ncbi:Uncharacterized protein OS=Pseudomonas putida SJ3 GN=O162_19960 PE=4 SV=1 [Gemmata massiliana]|uniref:Phage tail tape measure protein n=1 Tax=Gemmata massiliana TaxID=1210884 RepID=A0A6P2D579_9BACT|nr:hypothetical protein [Gemmata massiliana]VTR95244.1 Uncharacterized protein OS=Pseudomonas putida SJ3 GN=O162_19960 PE=4 SV=1 [Gemmata massiliana]
MSQTAIGQAALVLTTNAASLRTGLDKAGADAKLWADKTAKDIDSKLRPAGKDAGSGFARRLADMGRVAGPAAVAAGSLIGVKKAVESIDDLAKQGAAAKAFGLTAEQFTAISGLAKSVGEDTREFIESLVTLQKLGSEGAAGKGEVAPAFFQAMNISAKEFTALRLDEQFYRVFESIKNLSTEGEQVRALMTAFGEDGGKYLLPLLARSGSEIRQLAAGFAISSRDIGTASKASEAFARAQLAIEQLWRRIVVAAAPVLEFIASEIKHTADQFGHMESKGVPALTKILRLTASLADATKAVTAATLIATGVRLKFAQTEIILRGAATGGLKGLAAGIAVSSVIEGLGGAEIRAAGTTLLNLGQGLLKDVGGSTKRVEQFISELEKRSRAPGVAPKLNGKPAPGTVVPDIPAPPPPVVKLADNAALLKGSAAEVSARIRNDSGARSVAEKSLAEHKKANKLLQDNVNEVKALASALSGSGGLLPL